MFDLMQMENGYRALNAAFEELEKVKRDISIIKSRAARSFAPKVKSEDDFNPYDWSVGSVYSNENNGLTILFIRHGSGFVGKVDVTHERYTNAIIEAGEYYHGYLHGTMSYRTQNIEFLKSLGDHSFMMVEWYQHLISTPEQVKLADDSYFEGLKERIARDKEREEELKKYENE